MLARAPMASVSGVVMVLSGLCCMHRNSFMSPTSAVTKSADRVAFLMTFLLGRMHAAVP